MNWNFLPDGQTADTFNGIVTSATDWLKTPFNTQGSALNWLGFVGLMIVIVFFWQVVLIDIQRDF